MEQNDVAVLDNLGVHVESSTGSVQACDVTMDHRLYLPVIFKTG